jgi:hypothetical protein
VGEVPAARASVDCGRVQFCLVWTKKSGPELEAIHPLVQWKQEMFPEGKLAGA